LSRTTAIVVTVCDVVLMIAAIAVVFISDDLGTILMGDLLAGAACLLAVPLLHFWIEGPPARSSSKGRDS
jgi:arginine exporter protein ArgO